MLDREFDVVIVGARVAGATLAALLGDAGLRVLLLDRSRFPSPTLSTHFFRGGRAVAVLRRLGVLDQALALGAPPLVRTYRHPPAGGAPEVGPPQAPGEGPDGIPYSLSVRRETLDHLLVRRAARAPSVRLLEASRVVGLLREGDRVAGVRLRPAGDAGVSTDAYEVRARLVVGADGRGSSVARAVGAPVQETEPGHRALYYRYVAGWTAPHGGPPDGPEFARIEDEQGYVFPSDGGATCLALSVSVSLPEYARLRRAPEQRFRERLMARPGLARRVEDALPLGPVLACGPSPNFVRVPHGPGWALVGDSGLHQDPWSGNGIDCATVHATFLAGAILDTLAGGTAEADALAAYHRRRDEQALEGYRRTVTLSRDLRQLDAPTAAPAAAPARPARTPAPPCSSPTAARTAPA